MGKLEKKTQEAFSEEVDIVGKEDSLCPHCGASISIEQFLPGGDGLSRRGTVFKHWGWFYVLTDVYSCPQCKKIISVSTALSKSD